MIREHVIGSEYVQFTGSLEKFPRWTTAGLPHPDAPWSPPNYFGAIEETWGWLGIGRSEFYSPPIYLPNLVNQTGQSSVRSSYRQFLGFEPRPDDGGISARVRYQEALQYNLYSFFSGNWNFHSSEAPTIKGENSVTHVNVSGSVLTTLGNNFARGGGRDPDTYSETYSPPHDRAVLVSDQSDDTLYLQNSHVKSYPWLGPPQRNGFDFLTYHVENHSNSYWVENYHDFFEDSPSSRISGLHFIVDDCLGEGTFTFNTPVKSIHYLNESCHTYYSGSIGAIVDMWYGTEINIYLNWVFTPQVIAIGSDFAISDLVTLQYNIAYVPVFRRWRYAHQSPEAQWNTTSLHNSVVYNSSSTATVATTTSGRQSSSGRYGVDKVLASNMAGSEQSSYFLVKDFRDSVAESMDRIYPAVYFSSKDAVEKCLDALEANHIENLTQLGSLRDLINPVKGFVELARHVASGNVLGSVLALFDLLTDAKLLYEYGIAPSVSDAEELRDKAIPLAHRLSDSSLYVYQTYNGKFTADLGDGVASPYTGLKLETRSKVRARLNPNSILAAFLPLESFGLFPSLSSIWDLIPGSFVADWFFNIGSRLENVDTVVKLLALDIQYSTHSAKIYWPISDQLLTISGVTPLSPHVELTYYVRSVMTRVPTLTYTDIDFNEAGGIPDWGTAFSLVWKLFR